MFLEEKIKTEVVDTFSVAVCGGGIAGIAAAICDNMTALDITKLQNILKDNGVVLHERDII